MKQFRWVWIYFIAGEVRNPRLFVRMSTVTAFFYRSECFAWGFPADFPMLVILTNGIDSPLLTHEIFTATFIATFIATFDENRLKPNRSQGLSPFSKPIDFSVCYENCEIIVKFNASCHLCSTIHININSVIDGQ